MLLFHQITHKSKTGAQMSSKAEVISFLKSKYDLEEIGDGMFLIKFTMKNGRSQNIFVGVLSGLIRIDSPIMGIASANVVSVMQESVMFGLGRVGDWLTVRHLLLTENLDATEVRDGFSLVAEAADLLEAKFTGGDAL
jgi:hypothetical protein